MKTKVIFFDLDDTLIPTDALYKVGVQAAWRRLSSSEPISWKRFLHLYNQARQDVKSRLGIQPSGRNRILYFKRLLELLHGHSDPVMTIALMRAFNTCWSRIKPANVRRLLARLSRTYEIGIVTNQVAGFQLEKLSKIDPRGRWITYVLTSEEVGCEKPNPRFFKEACRMARCRPAEAVMIGDSLTADIQGARRAGLCAVYVHAGRRSAALPRGAVQAASLSQLEKALAELSDL